MNGINTKMSDNLKEISGSQFGVVKSPVVASNPATPHCGDPRDTLDSIEGDQFEISENTDKASNTVQAIPVTNNIADKTTI